MKLMRSSAGLACLLAFSHPAVAADDMRLSGLEQRSTAGFAGLKVKLEASERGSLKTSARLGLGMTHFYHGGGSALSGQVAYSSPFEIGLSSSRRVDVFVAGQRLSDVKHRLGFGPLGAVLVIGGLAASALVVSEFASSEEEELNRRQCLLPEKELCR